MTEKVTDEMLMALADGELDAETEARLRARIETEADLRRRYAPFERSAEAVRGLFAPTLAEAPPDRLVAALRAAPPQPTVVPFGRGQPAMPAGWRQRIGSLAGLAIAASLAMGIGIGLLVGYGSGGGDGAQDGMAGLRLAAEALATHPSGEVVDLADGSRAAVLASFETAEGPCRHFQHRDAAGRVSESLGCRGADGWDIALVLPQSAGGDYVPAEGASSGALGAFLAAAGASAPLSPEAEAALIRDGWDG